MSEELAPPLDPPARLVQATVKLLAEQGPSAIKARTIAAEAGMSTMVVYHHFGGIPELVGAVIDHGFLEIESAFAAECPSRTTRWPTSSPWRWSPGTSPAPTRTCTT